MIVRVKRPVMGVTNFLKFIFSESAINFLSDLNRCNEFITPMSLTDIGLYC